MRKLAQPPMIIILDILFILVFVLVMEKSPNLKVILPAQKIPDVLSVSENKDRKITHWYNYSASSWEKIEQLKLSERKFNFIIGRISCEDYDYCKNIPKIVNEEKRIYVKGDLYDQLAGMISDSCLKFPKKCSSVTYHVMDNGEVDTEKLRTKYPIFDVILKNETVN